MHGMTLVSFGLFRKNLGNLREFFGQMVSPPPLAKNCPYAYGYMHLRMQCKGQVYTQPELCVFKILKLCCQELDFEDNDL